MEALYSLLDMLFPFQWMDHIFMKNAFLAVLLVTPLFGLLSTMVVSNRMAFFSDSLGHGSFTGLAIGVLLGGIQPLLALIVFSVLFSAFITYIKNKSSASTDTVIGVFSSTAIALGLMLMSYGGGFNKFSGYMIGDLLSITETEIAALAATFMIVCIVWALIFNQLLVISINSSLASSRGIRTMWIELFFASVLAVIVAISIQWVGLLVINSLLVLPAAAARNISASVKQYHLFSVAIAVFSGLTGLILSYYCNMATGATIVAVSAALFFVTLWLKPHFLRG